MPTLTLESLRGRLAKRELAPLHLFVGTDVRLMSRMVEAVEATVDEGDRPFAVERVHAAESGGSPMDIVAAARTMPMLGDRRVVVVMRAERLLKPRRAGKGDDDVDEAQDPSPDEGASVDATPLEEYLADPAPFTTVVFVAAEVDRGRRLTKRVLDKAYVTVFDGNELDDPRGGPKANLLNVLRGTLAREGRSIDRAGEQMLVDRAAGDVSKLRDDLEKVQLFAGDRTALTEDDVLAVSAESNAVDDEWAVTNAIAAGNAAAALIEAERRLARGDSPHALIGQIRWWVSNRLAGADASRVRPALEALLRTDLALKSSGGDERVLVERLVVELTGRAMPPQRWGR